MILIVTAAADPVAALARPLLAARGHEVVTFDPEDLPVHAALSLHFGDAARTALTVRGRAVALDQVDAIWVRCPGSPTAAPAIVDQALRDLITFECRDQLDDLWRVLACPFFPARPEVIGRAQLKSSQLALATRLGLLVPDTLVTTDPDAFLAFCRRHEGRVITKLASPTAIDEAGVSRRFVRYTERLRARSTIAVEAVRHCPVTVQAEVPKASEIRATVVDGDVFAAEIDSQRSSRARLDWRKHDPEHTPIRAHPLPAAIADACVALVRRLGLVYGAIDLIRRPDGAYVFLEVNPAGEYLWLEKRAGLPITAAICTWLARAPRGAS